MQTITVRYHARYNTLKHTCTVTARDAPEVRLLAPLAPAPPIWMCTSCSCRLHHVELIPRWETYFTCHSLPHTEKDAEESEADGISHSPSVRASPSRAPNQREVAVCFLMNAPTKSDILRVLAPMCSQIPAANPSYTHISNRSITFLC